MTDYQNLLYAKLTICKLIDQCAFRCIHDDVPTFHNLCESAFECAWNSLGIEDNYISAEDFYKIYDDIWCRLNESLGNEPPPISMLQAFKDSTTPWVFPWEDDEYTEEEIAIKSGYINYDNGGY